MILLDKTPANSLLDRLSPDIKFSALDRPSPDIKFYP
nr:MAG TPA_asm: hypothetical protein [Caudoviricetes sp.]